MLDAALEIIADSEVLPIIHSDLGGHYPWPVWLERVNTAGISLPRAIAASLNRQGIPSPHGGLWNTSTINGSRQRKNGILNNELYLGRITYNR